MRIDPSLRLVALARNLAGSVSRIVDAFRSRAGADLERGRAQGVETRAASRAEAAIHSARLAAVGRLVAGVAHEINNPLSYVRANLGQLREHWGALQKQLEGGDAGEQLAGILSEAEELIDESLEGVERALTLVRDIRGFAHPNSHRYANVELSATLDSALRIASAQVSPGTRLVVDHGEPIYVWGCEPELKQVFLNLIVNACQATGQGGTIHVETREIADHAVVCVADDGPGIEASTLERMFEPFFTTKPVGEGVGLGLSISHEIVERHGGEIRVQSSPEEGTRFCVHLPLHE